jgi:hypothetical protein
MALPVVGKFLQKVYANPGLGYSQDIPFATVKDVNPCAGGGSANDSDATTQSGGIDDMFE